jgi:hypothetical protein
MNHNSDKQKNRLTALLSSKEDRKVIKLKVIKICTIVKNT